MPDALPALGEQRPHLHLQAAMLHRPVAIKSLSMKSSMLSKRPMSKRVQLVIGHRLVCQLSMHTKALSFGRPFACCVVTWYRQNAVIASWIGGSPLLIIP